MHGVISFLETRLPTMEEIEQYRDGQFQSVTLTNDVAWEPYSDAFAKREVAARSASAVSSPRSKPTPRRSTKAEEVNKPRHSWNPLREERLVSVLSQLTSMQEPIELSDEVDLAT